MSTTLTAREQARFTHLAKKGGYKVTAKVSKAAPAKKVTKGASTVTDMGRKSWNRTLTAKARLGGRDAKGVSLYSKVLDQWADVQEARKAGYTPDEVLAQI